MNKYPCILKVGRYNNAASASLAPPRNSLPAAYTRCRRSAWIMPFRISSTVAFSASSVIPAFLPDRRMAGFYINLYQYHSTPSYTHQALLTNQYRSYQESASVVWTVFHITPASGRNSACPSPLVPCHVSSSRSPNNLLRHPDMSSPHRHCAELPPA